MPTKKPRPKTRAGTTTARAGAKAGAVPRSNPLKPPKQRQQKAAGSTTNEEDEGSDEISESEDFIEEDIGPLYEGPKSQRNIDTNPEVRITRKGVKPANVAQGSKDFETPLKSYLPSNLPTTLQENEEPVDEPADEPVDEPVDGCDAYSPANDMQIGSIGRHVSTPLSEFEGPPCAQPAHNTPLDITSPSPSPPLELTDARHRLQRQINKLRQADSLHGHGQQPQAPPLPTVSRTSNLHSEKIEKRREGRKMHCPTVLDQQEHINMDHAQAVQQRKTSAKRPRMSLSDDDDLPQPKKDILADHLKKVRHKPPKQKKLNQIAMTMELSSSTDDGSGEDSNAKKSASSGVKKDGSLMRNMPADKRRTMTAATRELREALYVHHAFPDEGKRLDFAVDAWEHAYMSSPWHAGPVPLPTEADYKCLLKSLSQGRGVFIRAARQNLRFWFSFAKPPSAITGKGEAAVKDFKRKHVNNLTVNKVNPHDYPFHYSKCRPDGTVGEDELPFHHECIPGVVEAALAGSVTEKNIHKFDPMPIELIALAATSVLSAIKEWTGGIHRMNRFDEMTWGPEYDGMLKALRAFSADPHWSDALYELRIQYGERLRTAMNLPPSRPLASTAEGSEGQEDDKGMNESPVRLHLPSRQPGVYA